MIFVLWQTILELLQNDNNNPGDDQLALEDILDA